MANSLGSQVTHNTISKTFLDAFYTKMAPFDVYTTDFSSDVSQEGAGVVTAIPTKFSSALSKASSGSYTSSDADLTDVIVSLSNHDYIQFEMDEVDQAKARTKLEELFVGPAADALAQKVHDTVMNLITSSNYSNGETVAPTAFNYDKLVDVEAAVDALGWDDEKAIILPSSYIATLRKDSAVTDGFKNQVKDDSLIKGSIGELGGFTVFKDNRIPANGQNLAGFAASKRGIAIAARALPSSEYSSGAASERNIELPNGLTVRQTFYRDFERGKNIYRWDILYGASKAAGDGIYRITSA